MLGPVFRTYEPNRDRLVAVKVFRLDITPEQARALADALSHAAEAGLFHPSIVEPIAAGVEGSVAYSAEEYVAAETLDVAMRHYAPATLDKALPFITQLAGAIDFARVAGVGHGALHPRDIFVTPEEARATGFGVVNSLEKVGLRAPVRRPYSAPERIDAGEWSTPADIFSLAAIAFELLTGRRPSGVGSGIGTLAGANVGDRADALLRVLATAMDADPARRYPTALAFAAALESASRPEASVVPFPAPATASVAPTTSKPADPPAVPAAAPPAPVPVPVDAANEDDIASERDEDELHHDLLLREREEAAAAEAAMLAGGHAEEDPEAAADRLLISAGAIASDDPRQRVREDDVREADVVPSSPRAVAPDPVAPRARTLNWDEDTTPPGLDREDAYRPAAAVVPAQGSRVLPLAAILSIGLLVGFAVGYGVGSRDPGVQPASSPTASDSPSPAPATAAGKDYSEQTVAQPTGTSAGASREPSTTPPLVSSETPAEPPRPRTTRGPLTTGRIVVRSTPSRAGVTVNDRWRGRTPLTLEEVPFGRYSLRVVQPGYAVAREQFELSASDPARTFSIRLQPENTARTPARPAPQSAASKSTQPPAASTSRRSDAFTGSIYVDSRPRGARVFVDGRAVGTTPLSLPDVPIGAHVVRLELPDHRPWTSSTRVTSGEQVRVTGSLERVQ